MGRNHRFGAVFGLLLLSAASAFGQLLQITQFSPSTAQGGLNIQAEYDLGAAPCCDPANVRWLQRILLLDANGNVKNNVPGYPSGDFIDPQPAQPGGPFDNQPWYDITYNSAADRTTDTNRQGGAGRFFNDSPGGWGPFGAMQFLAFTALVCIDSTGLTGEFIGGFTWGFSVAANGAISGIGPKQLANTQATADMFNNSLAMGAFANSGWVINPGDVDCQLTFQSVPEPFTMSLSLAAGALAIRRMRTRRRSA